MKPDHRIRHRGGRILPKIWIIALILIPNGLRADSGAEVIRRIQVKFESLSTLTLHFEVRYQIFGSSESTPEAGRLFLDNEGRFRLESPSRTIVSDGKTVWMYDPQQQQVIIQRSQDQYGEFLNPHLLLFEYPSKYRVEKVEKGVFANLPCDILSLTPKDPADPTRKLQAWIDCREFYTRKVVLEDLAENVTTFEFSDFMSGQKLPDGVFIFTPAAGDEVIDTR